MYGLHAIMRIFVGYGYNERDKWVEEYVLPLLVALGCEVIHGRAVYGGALPDEVMKGSRWWPCAYGTALRESMPCRWDKTDYRDKTD